MTASSSSLRRRTVLAGAAAALGAAALPTLAQNKVVLRMEGRGWGEVKGVRERKGEA